MCFSVGILPAVSHHHQPGRSAVCGHCPPHEEGLLQPRHPVPRVRRGRLPHRGCPPTSAAPCE